MSCPHTFQVSNRKTNQKSLFFFLYLANTVTLQVFELVWSCSNNQGFQRVDDSMPVLCGMLVEEDLWRTSDKLSTPLGLAHLQSDQALPACGSLSSSEKDASERRLENMFVLQRCLVPLCTSKATSVQWSAILNCTITHQHIHRH